VGADHDAAGTKAPWNPMVWLTSDFRTYIKAMPNNLRDIHLKYSEEYVRRIREMYRERPAPAGPPAVRAEFDRLCLQKVETYLKDLLSRRGLEAVAFEFVD
jgi:hypothetical protein